MDSPIEGLYRHFLTAVVAASTSRGCPPSGLTSLTVPLGATVISSLTDPITFIFLASSGYCGATLEIGCRSSSVAVAGRQADNANESSKAIKSNRIKFRTCTDLPSLKMYKKQNADVIFTTHIHRRKYTDT